MHTNHNNKIFYEMSPENFIYTVARSAGLISNPDIQIVLKYIEDEKAVSVVDLGAGEGRVIQALLPHLFIETIVGVEYAEAKSQLLKKMFIQYDRISILHQDVLNLSGSYDYGLLLFSVILDFTKMEQEKLMQNLSNIIKKRIFIDMPKFNAQKNGIYLPDQVAAIEMEWGRLEGFFPHKDDLLDFFKNTPFHLQAIEAYKTDTNRERELFIFSR